MPRRRRLTRPEDHPDLARLAARFGPFALDPPEHPPFTALARAIVFQQLAGVAASAIWRRVEAAVGPTLTPEAVLATDPLALRAAGLSGAKLASLLDLAAHAADGRLAVDRLDDLADDEVVAALVPVRGIGRWTAEMFLLFHLRRPDVWPVTDLGVRKGWAAIRGLPELPAPKELHVLGEPYRPFRSALAWWCWRAVDTTPPG